MPNARLRRPKSFSRGSRFLWGLLFCSGLCISSCVQNRPAPVNTEADESPPQPGTGSPEDSAEDQPAEDSPAESQPAESQPAEGPPAEDLPTEPTLPEPIGEPTRSTFRITYHSNMHTPFGAQGQDRSSEVVLERYDNHALRLVDAGHRGRYNMRSRTETVHEERQDWSLSWAGTWSQRGADLSLELHLREAECGRVVTETGRPETRPECSPMPRSMSLFCEPIPSPEPSTEQTYRCVQEASGERGPGSDTPWIFREGTCLSAVYGGRLGLFVGQEICSEDGE